MSSFFCSRHAVCTDFSLKPSWSSASLSFRRSSRVRSRGRFFLRGLASYAPRYLPLLGERTAPARWTEDADVREAWELACELGPPPWVVKDHVKSAKERWHRACFVPPGATYEDFAEICAELVETRGERFARGFVIKKWLAL